MHECMRVESLWNVRHSKTSLTSHSHLPRQTNGWPTLSRPLLSCIDHKELSLYGWQGLVQKQLLNPNAQALFVPNIIY